MGEEFDAPGFAAYALSQLLFKDSSVEVGVRSVLRLAEHKGLTSWRLWATLQLTTLDAETFDKQIAGVIDADFPEIKVAGRKRLIDEAIDEYNYLRSCRDSRCLTVSSVTILEKDAVFSEKAFKSGELGPRQIALGYWEMLTRIKSRVQDFLTTIERGESPVIPPHFAVLSSKKYGPLKRVDSSQEPNDT